MASIRLRAPALGADDGGAPDGHDAHGRGPEEERRALDGGASLVQGLFVADGSLFPTSIGGPPQISVYAFALRVAGHVVERAKGG